MKQELKYNLNAILSSVPKGEWSNLMTKFKEKGIKPHNLYVWGNIKMNSFTSISFEKALDIAEVLNIDVNQIHKRKILNSTKPNQ